MRRADDVARKTMGTVRMHWVLLAISIAAIWVPGRAVGETAGVESASVVEPSDVEAGSRGGAGERGRIRFVGKGFRVGGMYAGRSFPVYVPRAWQVLDGHLNLVLQSSPLLNNANVTAVLNGVDLGTVLIDAAALERPLVLAVPARAVVQGWNVLELRFYLRASDDPCQDLDNPGLWAWVSPETALVLPHDLAPVVPDLQDFPVGYADCDTWPRADSSSASDPLVTFLLPERADPAVLEIVAVLAARFGAVRLCASGNIGVKSLGGAPDSRPGSHLVVVGTVAQAASARAWGLPVDRLAERLAAWRSEHDGKGLFGALVEEVNPWNTHRRVLFAVGSSRGGLRLLLDNLRSGRVIERLEGPASLFLSAPPRASQAPGEPGVFTLADIGLSDIVLRGVTGRRHTFTIPVPRHWRLGGDARLHLKLRHSVSFKRSTSLEVTMDGVPVWTREFVPDLGGLETRELDVDVPIPAAFGRSGAIRVAFHLYVDVGTDDCARPYDDSSWVVVRRDSEVWLSRAPGEVWDLGAWPDLFVRGPRLERTGLVLDRASGLAGVRTVAEVASALGDRSGVTGDLEIKALWAEDFGRLPASAKGERAWIAVDIGPLDPSIAALAGRLPLPLDGAGRVVKEARLRYSILESTDHAALWELCPSPWNPAHPVLLVAARAPAALALGPIGAAWGDSRLQGNVAMFLPPVDGGTGDRRGAERVTWRKIVSAEPDAPAPPSQEEDSRWIWLLVSCAGFALALLGVRKTWRRRRD